MKLRRLLNQCIILFAALSAADAYGATVSPYDYGLRSAKTGEDRYWVLYNTHRAAVKKGAQVDYTGIGQIDIDIPEDAKTIPLTEKTDFRGLVLSVNNTKRGTFTLFKLANTAKPIDIAKTDFCSYSFARYPELAGGVRMLIVQDETPWVDNRTGHDYGAVRKDVVVVRNGRAVNETIYPYTSAASKPSCQYVEETSCPKYFRNITFLRTDSSTGKTFLIRAQYVYNLEISGINIYTDNPNDLTADKVIAALDCANLTISNCQVKGTYSLKNKSGYAFYLDNVCNVTVRNVYGDAPWGVFDCNNINRATLKGSNLNRFDLHCYGRDYSFERCTIRDNMPMSSMFGKVTYRNCVFDYAYPCYFRSDYNAYTPFDLSFERCKFKMDTKHSCIIYMAAMPETKNSRVELSQKCFPNISIKNCEVWLDDAVSKWEVIHMTKNQSSEAIGYISSININGLDVHGSGADMYVVSQIAQKVTTERNVDINLSRIKNKGNSVTPVIHNHLNKGTAKNRLRTSRVGMTVSEE